MRMMRDATKAYEGAVRLHRTGRLTEAERAYRTALQADSEHAGLLHGMGVLCAQTGRMEEAASMLERAHAATPGDGEIRANLAQALLRLGRPGEALPHLQANAAGGDAVVLKSLGDALLRLGRFHEAIGWYEKALVARPGAAPTLMGLGDALSIVGRSAEARDAFEQILARDPHHAAAHYGLGILLLQQGATEAAQEAFRQAIALAPKVPAFHRALAETARFVEGDPRLTALEALAGANMPAQDAVELHFALAKAYDDLERRAEAAAQWVQGNAAKRSLVAYNEAAVMDVFGVLERMFTADVFADGGGSEMPVFVVGMPRSGTSLVEQMLASHPEMFGAGELTTMNELVAEGAAGADYPHTVPSAEIGRALGARYTTQVTGLAPAAKRIVDKLPGNFLHAGLIRLALPCAKIIHVRRDPLDTCFSCWSKLFPGGIDYTYDLGELARYYKAYERLMAHWRAVLPPGTMIEVQYEQLVRDFASEARRLVEFCGLEWDTRCLAFHENRRTVRTLSQSQVRQPLYQSAIDRWRPYEPWLKPLISALDKKRGR